MQGKRERKGHDRKMTRKMRRERKGRERQGTGKGKGRKGKERT